MAHVTALIGQMQKAQPLLMQAVKVHPFLVAAEIGCVALLPGQHALLDQRFKADEVRIARKRGI